MTREIKFRMYDAGIKRMLTWAELQRHSVRYLFGYTSLPVMQFTGLRDKNGVEIYESDIVRFTYNSKPPAEYVGEVKWDERDLAWTFARMLIEPTPRKTIEVIGNIYQHPNLLKEASNHV